MSGIGHTTVGSGRGTGGRATRGLLGIGLAALAALALGATQAPAASAGGLGPRAHLAANGEPTSTGPQAPANDEQANAQAIASLPSALHGTTVGATVAPQEAIGTCASKTTGNSVWYSLSSGSAQRVALALTAAGKLEAVVSVYSEHRSQLQEVGCEQTGAQGRASLSFNAAKGQTYEIRVASLTGAEQSSFVLEAFVPRPAVGPPGTALPSEGVTSEVDRVQDINQAYAVSLHAGVSYLINLYDETSGACVSAGLFAPDVRSFGARPRLSIGCGGYRLFTPGAGEGGRYSIQVLPSESFRGPQSFHVQVAEASPLETSPGELLGNYSTLSSRLEGRRIAVVRLYRVQIESHSNLTLSLTAPQKEAFSLALLDEAGRTLECQCSGEGSLTLQHKLPKGRYYVEVSARKGATGDFSLRRESRTITRTTIAFTSKDVPAGSPTSLDVHVSPSASGPVTVEVQRFDPVFGWQFYTQMRGTVSEGHDRLAFTPPSTGLWRANATYEGSRVDSPSAAGFIGLQAGEP